jgi:hypothetical protein
MQRMKYFAPLLLSGLALAACGSGSAAGNTVCRTGAVSVTVADKPVMVCVKVGTSVVMRSGGGVDGYWPGSPSPSNTRTLQLLSYSSTGLAATAGGGKTPSGSQPSATTIKPGTLTAHFKALAPGTARVAVQFVGSGPGYPLDLTVKVVQGS